MGGDASTATTSFWSATRLVAEREVQAMLRSKGVWVLFGVFVVGLFAASVLPGVFGGSAPAVATVGPHALQLVEEVGLDAQPVPDAAAAAALVRDGEVAAAVVPDVDDRTGVRIVALSAEPREIMLLLSVTPTVELLEPSGVDSFVQYLVVLAFGMTFLVFGASFGTGIAQSVVTEKQTRVVEILVATVPVRALLAGKIIGHSLLVFAQVAVLALLAPVALRAGGQGLLLAMIGPALGWFVPFFVLGFVLLAAMWAAAAALVSRMEDLGATTPIVTMLVMLPYFGVVFLQDNEAAMRVLSYVPFSAAVAMPVRLFTGDAHLWEPPVAMALLVLAMVVTVLVASRLYAGSLLQMSGRVRLRQAWSRAE
jgi:ABC-2 type transport system permease protein